MIKVGDRLICKKNFHHKSLGYEYNFFVNNEYEVISEDNTNSGVFFYIKAHCCPDNTYRPGINFHSNKDVNTYYIYDYFITLAEWRELQMRAVLED